MDTLFVIILAVSLSGDSSYTRIPTTQTLVAGDTLHYDCYEMYLKGRHGFGEYIGRDWEWLMEVRKGHE